MGEATHQDDDEGEEDDERGEPGLDFGGHSSDGVMLREEAAAELIGEPGTDVGESGHVG
jgi:hypothetical protein